MPDFEVRVDPELPFDDVLDLYASVGWSVYTAQPDTLREALRGSSFVAAAFEGAGLIGLVRVVSDDATICYLQDVLVRPDAHRGGVGRALLTAVRERYAHVRQHVLLTDDEPRQRAFYESLGFAETRDYEDGALRAFVRFGKAGPVQ